MTQVYAASCAPALSGKWSGFVPVILRGKADSVFPPNVIEKRISRKAYDTKAEARIAAHDYIRVNRLPLWKKESAQ